MFDLPDSILVGARLDEVAQAVAEATSLTRYGMYVERRGDVYRWSLASRGGPYPLLREMARILRIEYYRIVLPFRTLAGLGLAIVDAEPKNPAPPDASAVLQIDSPVDAPAVNDLILSTLDADNDDDRPLTEDEILRLSEEMGAINAEDDRAEVIPIPKAPRPN